jgi:hypothetical protein
MNDEYVVEHEDSMTDEYIHVVVVVAVVVVVVHELNHLLMIQNDVFV